MAHLNPITGIPNESYFHKVLDLEWRRALREKWPLSLMLVQVNDFSTYREQNDIKFQGDLNAKIWCISHVRRNVYDFDGLCDSQKRGRCRIILIHLNKLYHE